MAHHEVYIIIIRSPPLQHRSHVPAAVRSWRQAIWFQWAPKTGGQTKMPSDARGWQPPPREQAKDSAACSVRSRCCTSSPSTDNLCRTNRDDRTAPSSTCRHHHNRWLLVRQLTRRMFQPPHQPGGFLRLQSAELREVPMHIRQHLQTLLLPPNASLRDVKAKPRLPHPATVEIGIYMWYHIVQACSSTVPGTKESMPLVRPLSAGRLQKARAEISSRQDPCRCQFRVDEILILGLWLEFCSLCDGLFNVLPCASLWRD